MSYMFSNSLLAYFLLVNLPDIITVRKSFFFLILCFKTYRLGGGLVRGMGEEACIIWTPSGLVADQVDQVLVGTGTWVIRQFKSFGV